MKEVSLVIPVYNEAGNIPSLVEKINQTMTRLNMAYECIFVDDGSQDESYSVLKDLKKKYEFVRVIKFKRNFGQTQAMAAGFKMAEGKVIITMDADLQNDPADIPNLLVKLDEGYDIVSGWRDKRKDPFLSRKLPSFIANRIICVLTGLRLHDFGCTLKAYRRDVLKNLKLYGDMHRFIPAIASHSGIRIAEVRVMHHNRMYGESKYGISRTLKVLFDLITVKFFMSFFQNPMRLFGAVGLLGIIVGGLFLIISAIMKYTENIFITGNPLFYMSIFMGFIGVQCVLLGILGEMNVRIYQEMSQNYNYVIEETI